MDRQERDREKARQQARAKHDRLREALSKAEAELEATQLQRVKEEASGYAEFRARQALVLLDGVRTMAQLAHDNVVGEGRVWGRDNKALPLNDSGSAAEYHFDAVFEALTAIEELVRGAEMSQWFQDSQ